MQLIALVTSFIGMAVVAYFFVSSIRASASEAPAPAVESRRKALIWGMLALGAVLTVVSLWSWPHKLSGSQDQVTINATGGQWYWDIDTEQVPLNRPVVFNVHTEDVTHGLGVMGTNGRLLFQAQAVPGYVNKVEYIFSEPGIYKVVCLEFCGIAHHDMITEFEVMASTEAQ